MMVGSERAQGLPPSPDISPEWVIIHDIGGSDSNASTRHEIHELEFDRALEFTPKIIVIEPRSLADATTRWINIGNGLNRVGIACGLATAATFSATKSTSQSLYIMFPLVGVNALCCTLYNMSWSSDPCVHYQVNKSPKILEELPTGDKIAKSVILVRSSDTKRRVFHTTVTLVALSLVVLRVFQWFKHL
ncbi:transmembrane protein 11, mitochondrial [Galendromus occidentalis]|uniref:Transmembrane protein 11, mitochondrial n=1 Tax=Galendromus occidentalis TaxID=34638 RepID=A0AAJ6QWB0_9ACAR|nr:transmembrane protein 11, mitochondrial [Galendromus occidentalis]